MAELKAGDPEETWPTSEWRLNAPRPKLTAASTALMAASIASKAGLDRIENRLDKLIFALFGAGLAFGVGMAVLIVRSFAAG